MHRRGLAAVFTAGLLVLLPSAALAQDGEEAEVGIGEADAVVCRGAVAATVVDLDGATVGGAVLSVANQHISGSGTVEADCGEVGATLLSAPEGYAAAGPTSMTVPVRNGATSQATFTVDPVQVLGTQFEQPVQDEAAPDPHVEAASAPDRPTAPELPATGPRAAPTLLLVALLSGLFGTVLVAGTPVVARPGGRD